MGKHTKKERKWRGNGKTHKEDPRVPFFPDGRTIACQKGRVRPGCKTLRRPPLPVPEHLRNEVPPPLSE
jgi:hypothetical protein